RVTRRAMTQAPTSSMVFARLNKKSPDLTKSLGSIRLGSVHVLLSFSSYSPQVTALTLTTPTSDFDGGRSSQEKLRPASILVRNRLNGAHDQPGGNGSSSSTGSRASIAETG